MSNSQKRLAIYLPTLVEGGAERVLLNLAVGFVKRGYPVDFVLARDVAQAYQGFVFREGRGQVKRALASDVLRDCIGKESRHIGIAQQREHFLGLRRARSDVTKRKRFKLRARSVPGRKGSCW